MKLGSIIDNLSWYLVGHILLLIKLLEAWNVDNLAHLSYYQPQIRLLLQNNKPFGKKLKGWWLILILFGWDLNEFEMCLIVC